MTKTDPALLAERRKSRELGKYLRELTRVVLEHLSEIDKEMRGPSTLERGRRIAALCNQLELANDRARHFGLGDSLKKRQPRSPRRCPTT